MTPKMELHGFRGAAESARHAARANEHLEVVCARAARRGMHWFKPSTSCRSHAPGRRLEWTDRALAEGAANAMASARESLGGETICVADR